MPFRGHYFLFLDPRRTLGLNEFEALRFVLLFWIPACAGMTRGGVGIVDCRLWIVDCGLNLNRFAMAFKQVPPLRHAGTDYRRR